MCWGVPMIAPCSLRWAQERSHRKNQHGISCETVLTKFMDDEALTELKKSVNLVSREPRVLVSSYRFNACHIPERTQCWIQYSTNPDRIVWASVRFCKIWWVCLLVFLNWLNWMLCDSSLHSRNLIPAVLCIPVGFLIKCTCYFFTCNWVGVSFKQKPSNASFSHVKLHMCSFLGLKEKDQPETLDIGKITSQIIKGTRLSTELKDEVTFQKDSQNSSCLLWCYWIGRSCASVVLMLIYWFRYKP